jgi:hypothetical protein
MGVLYTVTRDEKGTREERKGDAMKSRRELAGLLAAACMVLVPAALFWACKAPPLPDYEPELVQAPEPKVETPQVPTEEPGPQPVNRKGEIVFSETTADVGDVKRGEWASHTFTIKNKSDKPIRITRVKGG